MSNELAAFGNALSDDIRKQLAEQAKSDQERVGPIGGRDAIRVTQDKRFELPDGTQVDEFEAHIVEFVYRNEFYEGTFNRKVITPPVCFAISESAASMIPSESSPKKQNKTDCATCQQNQFGSSPTGEGKACKNTVMLAIIPPNDAENHPIWVIKTSPTAMRPFNTYVSKLQKMNIPVSAVKTRIFLDPDSTYASMRFEPVGVEPDNLPIIASRKAEAMERLKQEPDLTSLAK